MNFDVPGIPEGVRVVRIGIANAEDYQIFDGVIMQGPRAGSVSQVIVEPAPGWKFRPHFDIRNYRRIFVPAKPVDLQEITAKFVVTDTYEQEQVAAALEALKAVPGYVDPEKPADLTK